MKVTYKLLIVAACCLPVQALAIEKVSVSELLDRYAANQDKLRSVIAKTEETIINTQSNRPTPKFTRWGSELRTDGKRTLWRFYRWLDLTAKDVLTPLEHANYYHFFLWDGKRYFEYNKHLKSNEAHVFISANKKEAKYILNHAYHGAPFLGVRYSDSERIDSVLRHANSISIRDKLEQVGSVACYVIDAQTKSGNYTIWLNPEHGYNIAKADVRVEPNNLYRGRRLKDNDSYSLSIRNVHFKNIDGVWIPMEADSYSTSSKQDGPTIYATIHHKITKITLNPAHDVLGSFVPEMEKGTNIHLDSGSEYTWREGMKFVADKWDGSIKYVPKEWSILVGVGKTLPKFEGIKLNLSSEQTKNRAILICFFDMNQRPSRHCIRQLAQKAAALKEKGIIVAAVQTSQVTEKTLNEWIKKYNIPFSAGVITEDIEKTRFVWGVRSLPWLILTDKQHVVTAEGFNPAELDIEKLSVSELLDRYAANQDKLKSFITKSEETTVHTSVRTGLTIWKTVAEFRVDGDRVDYRSYRWRNLASEDEVTNNLEEAQYRSFLWDGSRHIHYRTGETLSDNIAAVHRQAGPYKKRRSVAIEYGGAPLLGIFDGDEDRVDSVLRKADSISVRDELEHVGGAPCYVIDAKTKWGTYTVWIDPEHGYNITKADVQRKKGDLIWRDRTLTDNSSSFSLKNVRFEKINDVWIPMEADIGVIIKKPTYIQDIKVKHQRTEVILNPDHDALGSFVPDIENGTRVYIDEAPGITYTWQDGMKFVVDERDGDIRYVPNEWSILVGVGKPLPQLEGIKLNLSSEQTKNRAILLCFFDMNQRPSRNGVRQLAQKAEELKEKGIIIAAIQTSQVTNNTLNEWAKTNNIPFPVGAITADIEKTRFVWGVRSLPWLILTDKQHVVTAEGFNPAELDEKLGKKSKH